MCNAGPGVTVLGPGNSLASLLEVDRGQALIEPQAGSPVARAAPGRRVGKHHSSVVAPDDYRDT